MFLLRPLVNIIKVIGSGIRGKSWQMTTITFFRSGEGVGRKGKSSLDPPDRTMTTIEGSGAAIGHTVRRAAGARCGPSPRPGVELSGGVPRQSNNDHKVMFPQRRRTGMQRPVRRRWGGKSYREGSLANLTMTTK